MAEHEGQPYSVKENAAEAGIDDALHQHVDGFARAAETGFKHGEADLHAENKKRRHERPGVLTGLTTSAAFTVLSAARTLVKKMPVKAVMISSVEATPSSLPVTSVAP